MDKIEWKLLWKATYKIVGGVLLVVGIGMALIMAALYLSGIALVIGFALFLVGYLIWIEYRTLMFKNRKY